MTTFEITIYQTSDLYWHCDDLYGDATRAQKRAKTYLQGAFNYSPHNMQVSLGDPKISAPQEIVLDTVEVDTAPCTNISGGNYDNLGQWWDDRIDFCSDLNFSPDVDLLLTDYDSEAGICINNRAACAEGGQHVAGLPSSHELYGDSRPHNSMQTAMHEVLHSILSSTASEHNVGYTYDHSGTKALTPNGTMGQNNVCGNYVDSRTSGYWEMRYSDCADSNMGSE